MTGTAGTGWHGEIGLDEAYGLETPDDNRALYRRWAASYDRDFIGPRGYVYHEGVAQRFLAAGGRAPVLDVGCGTGIVGEALRRSGIGIVDGIDISPEMLSEAEAKVTASGEGIYRDLVEADLTEGTGFASGSYSGVVSAGTFTHGHLGPDVLPELFRIAAADAVFAIGINAEHYAERGFDRALADANASGIIAPVELHRVRIYTAADDEHADDTALVAVFARSATPGG